MIRPAQSTAGRPARWTAAAGGGLLALTLGLTGCGTAAKDGEAGQGTNTYLDGVLATPSATSADPLSGDIRFATMLLHNQYAAVQASDHVMGREGIDGEVRRMAEDIKGEAEGRIPQLKERLEAWGKDVPEAPGELTESSASPTPSAEASAAAASDGQIAAEEMRAGLLTNQDREALLTSNDDEAGKVYLLQMHRLYQGAVTMAGTEEDEGTDDATRKLAADLLDSYPERMQRILEKLGEMGVVGAKPSPNDDPSGYQGPILLPSVRGGEGGGMDYTPSALYSLWETLPPNPIEGVDTPSGSAPGSGSESDRTPSPAPADTASPSPADTASPSPAPSPSQGGSSIGSASSSGASSASPSSSPSSPTGASSSASSPSVATETSAPRN